MFLLQSYLAVPKNIRPSSTHSFVMKFPNKRELQQTAFNHSSDIDFQDFMNLYKKCTTEPYQVYTVTESLWEKCLFELSQGKSGNLISGSVIIILIMEKAIIA